ncbi:MAG: DUF4398 domain-containing protein [Polyangiaceae bacterium]|nr:DUF4398 domain-containing protein [Polyangiaceae bacterium]
MTRSVIAVIALGLAAGCAGSVMSPSKLTASEASVRGAEEVGAAAEPKAGLQLKLAQDQLAEAKVLSKDGDGEAADRMLARAQVDADLAIALAKEASAKREAELVAVEIRDEIEEAKKEVPR